MTNSFPKLKLVFAILIIALAFVAGCRKNTTDPNAAIIAESKKPGTRQLVISAINPSTNDSLVGFSLSITTPLKTLDTLTAGKRLVIKNPVNGKYTATISKTGYVSSQLTFTVILPTNAAVSMVLNQSGILAKAADPVTITTTLGGSVAVNANADVSSSPVVASIAVPAGVVFTLPDGTKPASVSLSATNVPTQADLLKPVIVNGVAEVHPTNVQVVSGQIPLKTLDLQPEGLTFDKPMDVELSIADMFPASLPPAYKQKKLDNLTLNYVHKDGTIEKISPDHFSSDKSTVYFKINHFSTWNLADNGVSMVLQSTTLLDPALTYTGNCGESVTHLFEKTVSYEYGTGPNQSYLPWILTNTESAVVYSVSETFTHAAAPGLMIEATWACQIQTWLLTDSSTGDVYNVKIPIPGNSASFVTAECHNQGGN